jgi:hypothetical protein
MPVQGASQDFSSCYETVAPMYVAQQQQQQQQELQEQATAAAAPSPPTHTLDVTSTDVSTADPSETQFTLSSNGEKFQAEINKWEEFYDQIHQHLSTQSSTPNRSLPKSASNFSLGQDGAMYFCKTVKDGSHVYLSVVRDYAERVRICKEIHHDTGDVTLHHRRDKMLELLGQMYYWKGQRRDVCRCVSGTTVSLGDNDIHCPPTAK